MMSETLHLVAVLFLGMCMYILMRALYLAQIEDLSDTFRKINDHINKRKE